MDSLQKLTSIHAVGVLRYKSGVQYVTYTTPIVMAFPDCFYLVFFEEVYGQHSM